MRSVRYVNFDGDTKLCLFVVEKEKISLWMDWKEHDVEFDRGFEFTSDQARTIGEAFLGFAEGGEWVEYVTNADNAVAPAGVTVRISNNNVTGEVKHEWFKRFADDDPEWRVRMVYDAGTLCAQEYFQPDEVSE